MKPFPRYFPNTNIGDVVVFGGAYFQRGSGFALGLPPANVEALIDFDSLPANTALVGDQIFRVRLRKDAINSGASGTPTVTLQLWDNGSFVSTLVSNVQITSETGQTVEVSWASSLISGTDPDGANVQLKILGTASQNRTIEIGAVEWEVSYYTVTAWAFNQALFPNGVTLTHLSGSYTDIDEDTSTPDGNWLVVQ